MATERIRRVENRVQGGGAFRPGSPPYEESEADLTGYTRALERVHGGVLHGTGVVEGLAVVATVGSAGVRVTPGVAVDTAGTHIVLAPGGTAELSELPDQVAVPGSVTPDGVAVSTSAHTGTCAVTVQFRETTDQNGLRTEQTPWLRVAPAPPKVGEPPRVVLAVLTLDADGAVLAGGATVGDRSGPVTPVAAVEVRTPVATATATDLVVQTAVAGTVRAAGSDGVRLEAARPTGRVELGADHGTAAVVDVAAQRLVVHADDPAKQVVLDATASRVTAGTVAAGTVTAGAGGLGVGTTASRSPVAVRGTGPSQELLSFEDPTGRTVWHVNQSFGQSGLNFVETGRADGRLFLEAGGNVGIGTTNPGFTLDVAGTVCAQQFCNPSDVRLKRDVAPLRGVLDRLAGVRGVTWRPEERGERQAGVLAQQVERAFPELVVRFGDDDLRAVDYAGLAGVLVEAVHELLDAGSALAARLRELEQRMDRGPTGDGGAGA